MEWEAWLGLGLVSCRFCCTICVSMRLPDPITHSDAPKRPNPRLSLPLSPSLSPSFSPSVCAIVWHVQNAGRNVSQQRAAILGTLSPSLRSLPAPAPFPYSSLSLSSSVSTLASLYLVVFCTCICICIGACVLYLIV